MAGERILFVDDEEGLAKLWKQLLGKLGYRVTALTDPREALRVVAERPGAYELVISDIVMPEMRGDLLAEELLKIRPDLPIILCTGFNMHGDRNWKPPEGIRGFLQKPFPLKEAASLIQSVLAVSPPGGPKGS